MSSQMTLRIREQEVGANSGQWGSLLNVSLENIAESWSYGTEALADSAAQTLTLADGASDQLRSFLCEAHWHIVASNYRDYRA